MAFYGVRRSSRIEDEGCRQHHQLSGYPLFWRQNHFPNIGPHHAGLVRSSHTQEQAQFFPYRILIPLVTHLYSIV
jgi:hypothetical protein